ncbi:GNAT family N-acetyltransferase [Flavobacterium sp.]|uniref:GNAT family N-acetyltransferase n=1 Tax=Flavobacterium sp. TaxID=239 RepID=UPI0039E36CD2
MKVAETQRLILRQFSVDDAEQMFLLNSDPEVIKYTGDPAFKNTSEARSFLENYNQYQKYGFGRWAVTEKMSGAFLGWCGLKYDPNIDQTDIGFRFFRKHWNKGFATESASASLILGFGLYNQQTIVGRAMKENTASIKVLEKLGMAFESEFDFYRGHGGVIYRIDKENFQTL